MTKTKQPIYQVVYAEARNRALKITKEAREGSKLADIAGRILEDIDESAHELDTINIIPDAIITPEGEIITWHTYLFYQCFFWGDITEKNLLKLLKKKEVHYA